MIPEYKLVPLKLRSTLVLSANIIVGSVNASNLGIFVLKVISILLLTVLPLSLLIATSVD